MTRAEAIASLDETAKQVVAAFQQLGLVASVIHDKDGDDEFTLICPDTLLVRPLLLQAAKHLEAREGQHKC